jgi:hypothetical protein
MEESNAGDLHKPSAAKNSPHPAIEGVPTDPRSARLTPRTSRLNGELPMGESCSMMNNYSQSLSVQAPKKTLHRAQSWVAAVPKACFLAKAKRRMKAVSAGIPARSSFVTIYTPGPLPTTSKTGSSNTGRFNHRVATSSPVCLNRGK